MVDGAVDRLAREYLEAKMEAEPTEALLMGETAFAAQHEHVSRASEDERATRFTQFVKRAARLRVGGMLTADEQLQLDVIEQGASDMVTAARSRSPEFDANHVVGFQAFLPAIVSMIPTQEPDVVAALPAKYRALGAGIDERTERLWEGLANGRTPPAREVAATARQIEQMVVAPLTEDPLLGLGKPPDRSDADWAAWLEEAIAPIVADFVRPALDRHRQVLTTEVLPHARSDDQIGIGWLPGGAEAYQAAIKRYTTLELDADTIHEIGLEAVARVREKMADLGPAAIGTKDVTEIIGRLRDDTSLRYESADAIVHDAEVALRRATEAAPSWFDTVPTADCVVEVSESGPDGWYMPPAPDGSRPGSYHLNVARPTNFGLELEAVTYHETIPGHHFQAGIAQENPDLPPIRRNAEITAFGEGWGLYAEQLAEEMELYSSPRARLGRLVVDSLRAVRLVVDTGIHAKGWSRSAALSYLVQNTPMATDALEAQLDRYVGQPGQPLAYELGRREILRLRSEATSRLGTEFRLAGFHDVILRGGQLPLPSLGRVIDAWVEASKAASVKAGS